MVRREGGLGKAAADALICLDERELHPKNSRAMNRELDPHRDGKPPQDCPRGAHTYFTEVTWLVACHVGCALLRLTRVCRECCGRCLVRCTLFASLLVDRGAVLCFHVHSLPLENERFLGLALYPGSLMSMSNPWSRVNEPSVRCIESVMAKITRSFLCDSAETTNGMGTSA